MSSTKKVLETILSDVCLNAYGGDIHRWHSVSSSVT